ncbi:hypothetical protein ABPG72_006503 [Tetrahymena utriculariae]
MFGSFSNSLANQGHVFLFLFSEFKSRIPKSSLTAYYFTINQYYQFINRNIYQYNKNINQKKNIQTKMISQTTQTNLGQPTVKKSRDRCTFCLTYLLSFIVAIYITYQYQAFVLLVWIISAPIQVITYAVLVDASKNKCQETSFLLTCIYFPKAERDVVVYDKVQCGHGERWFLGLFTGAIGFWLCPLNILAILNTILGCIFCCNKKAEKYQAASSTCNTQSA